MVDLSLRAKTESFDAGPRSGLNAAYDWFRVRGEPKTRTEDDAAPLRCGLCKETLKKKKKRGRTKKMLQRWFSRGRLRRLVIIKRKFYQY